MKGLTSARRRFADWRSTSSPVSRPAAMFTDFRSSRLTKSSASCVDFASACRAAWASRPSNAVRPGSPVSASFAPTSARGSACAGSAATRFAAIGSFARQDEIRAFALDRLNFIQRYRRPPARL